MASHAGKYLGPSLRPLPPLQPVFLSPIETIGILRQLADNGWVMNPIAVTVWSQFGEESYFCAWQASRLLGKAYEVPAVGPRSNVSIRKSTLHHHQRVPPLRAFAEPWPMDFIERYLGLSPDFRAIEVLLLIAMVAIIAGLGRGFFHKLRD